MGNIQQQLLALYFLALSVIVFSDETITTNEQPPKNRMEMVQECTKKFPNADAPWMGPPTGATLANMCLVKCVMELEGSVSSGSINCKNAAILANEEVLNLRKIKIDINEEKWITGQAKCCQDAVESELSAGDGGEWEAPSEEHDLCLRAHFLWHCAFIRLAQSIPPAQFNMLIAGTWDPEQKQQEQHPVEQLEPHQKEEKERNTR